MISVKRLTELKSDDLISTTQVSELMNVITHVANNAALKVNSSVTCQIVYSAVAGDLQGEIRLTASKSVFKYPKYAIQFQKLCAKKNDVNAGIIDSVITDHNGERFYIYGSKRSKGIDYAVVAFVNAPTNLSLMPFKRFGIDL